MAFEVLEQLAQRVIDLDSNKVLRQVFSRKDIQKEIIRLNTIGQLFEKGINAEGVPLSQIGGEYSPVTIELSKGPGKIPKRSKSHINLFDEGDFYKSWRIKVVSDGIIITADPDKGQTNLFSEWGKEIVGLTKESSEIIIKIILPHVKRIYEKAFVI